MRAKESGCADLGVGPPPQRESSASEVTTEPVPDFANPTLEGVHVLGELEDLRLSLGRSRIRIDGQAPRSIGKALDLVTNDIVGATAATASSLRGIASANQINISQKRLTRHPQFAEVFEFKLHFALADQLPTVFDAEGRGRRKNVRFAPVDNGDIGGAKTNTYERQIAVILIGGDGEGKRRGLAPLITFLFMIVNAVAVDGRLSASLEPIKYGTVDVAIPRRKQRVVGRSNDDLNLIRST